MKSSVPKVLHCVCGRPLLHYVLEVAKAVGSLKTCVVLGYQHEAVRQYLPKDVVSVVQKKLLGTADAVKAASVFLKEYRGDVLILCGDTPLLTKETVKKLIQKHHASRAACTFLTAVVEEPLGYGRIIRGKAGTVLAIREHKDTTDVEKNIGEINVGVYCFRYPELLETLKAIKLNPRKKEFYLTDTIEILVERGHLVATVETPNAQEGLGINTREDLAVSAAVVRQRILQRFMADGVTIVDPAATYIDADVKIGQDTTIHPFTVIENNIRIGKNCVIGPFARLRPGTKIANEAQVGNFTEVSRTHLGKKTLLKHFAFLGDARVGAKVNIGAGVVTANYDGKNKNVTHIADGAFVGSDSILIAPVKVGKKAITGAGCVIKQGTVIPAQGIIVGVPGRILRKLRPRASPWP